MIIVISRDDIFKKQYHEYSRYLNVITELLFISINHVLFKSS